MAAPIVPTSSALNSSRGTGSGARVCDDGSCYYATGWFVRPTQGDANWWHPGTLPGTTSILVRTYNNFSWVGLFNTRSLTANLEAEVDAALRNAFAGVTSFPTHDLFSTFP